MSFNSQMSDRRFSYNSSDLSPTGNESPRRSSKHGRGGHQLYDDEYEDRRHNSSGFNRRQYEQKISLPPSAAGALQQQHQHRTHADEEWSQLKSDMEEPYGRAGLSRSNGDFMTKTSSVTAIGSSEAGSSLVERLLEAKQRMEMELLKLKCSRENMKKDGATHNDQDMRDNAEMQNKLKDRISLVTEKIASLHNVGAAGVGRVLPKPVVEIEKPRQISRSPSPEMEEVKKKKKRRKRSSTSSSSTESEEEDKKKKKRDKKKNRKKSKKSSKSSDNDSSSSSSETEEKKVKQKLPLPPPHQDGGSGKIAAALSAQANTNDDAMMGILGRLSEAYMTIKKENKALKETILELQGENSELRKELLEKTMELKRRDMKEAALQNEKDKEKSNLDQILETLKEVRSGKPQPEVRSKDVYGLSKQPSEDKSPTEKIDFATYRSMKLQHEGKQLLSRNEATFPAADSRKSDDGSWPTQRPEPEWKGKNGAAAAAAFLSKPRQHFGHDDRDQRSYDSRNQRGLNRRRGFGNREWGRDEGDDSRVAEFEQEERDSFERRKKDFFDKTRERNYQRDEEEDFRSTKLPEVETARKTSEGRRSRSPSPAVKRRRDHSRSASRSPTPVKRRSRSRTLESRRKRDRSPTPKADQQRQRSRSNTPEGRRRSRSGSVRRSRSRSRHARDRSASMPSEKRRNRSLSKSDDEHPRKQRSSRSDSADSDQQYRSKKSEKKKKHKKKKKNKREAGSPPAEDAGDIRLEDWTNEKQSLTVDPRVMSLKKKLQLREEAEAAAMAKRKQEEEDEAERKRKEAAAAVLPEVTKALTPPPPEPARPPVAMQWGAALKGRQSQERSNPTKKSSVPIVGKMPGRGLRKASVEPPSTTFSIQPPREMSEPPHEVRIEAPNESETQPPPPPPSPPPPPPVEPEIPRSSAPIISAPPTIITQPEIAPPPKEPQPKRQSHPTPASLNLEEMLQAAQQHIRQHQRGQSVEKTPEPDGPGIEIPLPPLPAAFDKDPGALRDTRKVVKPKSPKPESDTYSQETMTDPNSQPTPVAMTAPSAYPMSYGAPYGYPSYPPQPPAYAPPPHMMPSYGWDQGYYAPNPGQEAAVAPGGPYAPPESEENELAMLGIDPEDLAGFGN